MLEVTEYNGIKVDSTWQHKNGNLYTVVCFTNTESTNPQYLHTLRILVSPRVRLM
jgi:hypothetical protein